MIIAHVSDFHISQYGAAMTNFRTGRRRVAKGLGWAPFWEDAGWRIDVRLAAGRIRLHDAFRLTDSQGLVHRLYKVKTLVSVSDIFDDLRRLRDIRTLTRCDTLAGHFPSEAETARLLQADPSNGNARFCAVAHTLRRDRPDWVVVTGDITDDGMGYELVAAGLAPFIEKGRLICIPGNHDVYPTPPLWNDRRFQKNEYQKRVHWQEFALALGLPGSGSYLKSLGQGVVLAHFDSCNPSSVPASASGMVRVHDLQQMEVQLKSDYPRALRLACLHHPVAPLRVQGLGIAAFHPGMRLRNAKRVQAHLKKMGFEVVMDGHRHIGYQYQVSTGPVFLSAPSTTYGGRLGAKPSYWRLSVRHDGLRAIQKVPIGLLSKVALRSGEE
ncbi:MAG: metallophosphoesterase [Candidatus Firestonebacteria bacterium]|nr:metallophosphoesterase [Candidatus Firestonebacteria bacterium]